MALIGLTATEVQELTGYKRASKQITALVAMGISFYVRPNGVPFVSRDFDNTRTVVHAKTPKLNKQILT
jgi:hypothetical protein